MKQTENLWITKERQVELIITKMRERLGVESLRLSQVADGIILLGELPGTVPLAVSVHSTS